MSKEIQLTQGQVAIIDDEDFERVSAFNWHATKTKGGYYAGRKYKDSLGKWRSEMLHRFILHAAPLQVVDHIDHNPLNNQKDNLRLCTSNQNSWNLSKGINNTTGFKGVSFEKQTQKFRAMICCKGKKFSLGRFVKAEDAAKAYNEAAIKYHGEFAALNTF